MWKWLTVFGLAAAPALVLGQSAAWAAAFRWHMSVEVAGVVIVFGGFFEGLVLIQLAQLPTRSPRFQRWAEKVNQRRVARWLAGRGPWIGMLFGTLFLGQEPFIVFFVWLGISPRKLVVPILVTNVLYTIAYWYFVRIGLTDWDQLMKLV